MAGRHRIDAILDGRLCSGCGGCAHVGRDSGVVMLDFPSVGRRPHWEGELPLQVKDAMADCCPGGRVESPAAGRPRPTDPAELVVGPSEAIWEGWATDPEIRRAASSGGVVTALATYCLERLGMALVVHTGMDPDQPWLNRTVVSTDRQGLLANAGSRYAPSSPLEALDVIEASDRPCVFIGKPCDVAAVARLRRSRPQLDRNLGLVLSFFCAGTPSTAATLSLAGSLGFDSTSITSVKYRGDGWPGLFRVRDEAGREASLTYEESWGALARRHRQLRCHLCPDGLGELADVTGGDAWHRRGEGTDGISLIMARSSRGREIVELALRDGYLTGSPSTSQAVEQAQGLVARRRLVSARIAALRVFGRPVPHFPGFFLAAAARQQTASALIKEFAGMAKRIVTRGYLKPEPRD